MGQFTACVDVFSVVHVECRGPAITRRVEHRHMPDGYSRAFVIRSQPQRERVAEQFLRQFGFLVYLPVMQTTVAHSGKVKTVDRPFLPMYLFLWDDGNCDLMKVRNAPGVSGYLRWGVQAAYAGAKVIAEQIQSREVTVERGGLLVQRIVMEDIRKRIKYKQDEIVKISDEKSPFYQMNAMFNCSIDSDRVSIFVSLLGREIPMKMSIDDIEKV